MPRGRIELRNHVESISVLRADGSADDALDPQLDADELRRLYETMLLARRFDEQMTQLHRREGLGPFHSSVGQEAASLGPAYVLRKGDWLCPASRECAALLYRGWPMEKLMLWWGGYAYGAIPPEGVHDLALSNTIAGQCAHAAGIAWGLKLRKDEGVSLVFVGDGGTSDGDFHESLNCAGTFQLPLIVVIQNNQWAGGLPRSKQTASSTLAQKALAYGFNGIQADGNDILAMILAAREAVERARHGEGPTLIEAVTYRLGEHTTGDGPSPNRSEEEVEHWKSREPLPRFARYLDARQVIKEGDHGAIEQRVANDIARAVERCKAFEADIAEPFRHCFATVPKHLQKQLDEFEAKLNHGREPGHGPEATGDAG